MGKRIFLDKLFVIFSLVFSFIVIFVLVWILKDVLIFGIKSINLDFFLEDPRPPGVEGGGLRNAVLGSLIITSIAIIISFPIALLSAVYINEYNHKISNIVRFLSDIMLSVPSIVIGAYAYALFVKPFKTFSAISGSIALAIISIPIILRMVDELIRLVPDATKEAAYSLGSPKWKVITKIVLSYIRVGILTSLILSFSRIFGETAPLLFTSFNNNILEIDITKPMATLTVNIFVYAMSPYESWHRLAWSASFFIVIFVLLTSIISRILQKQH